MAANDLYKQQAAEAAVGLIQPGMILGLGHGSTVRFALEAIAGKLKTGEFRNLTAIPCSTQTGSEMNRLGIPAGDLNQFDKLDITIDGADEVDPKLNLIKGGGGALLREKIVAQATKRYVIIIDEGKISAALGTKHPLPLEIIPFGWERQLDFIKSLDGKPTLRTDKSGKPMLSDQGNYLLDCEMGPIGDPVALARTLEARSGILEHGLFLDLATDVFAAGSEGLQHREVKR